MMESRIEASAEERQKVLLNMLNTLGSLTVQKAWEVGHSAGFYIGGDVGLVKDDLKALSNQRLARRHDGFWRHINEPDRIRRKYKRWADYWTPLGKGVK